MNANPGKTDQTIGIERTCAAAAEIVWQAISD